MPVPSAITDLSTTPGSNSPPGTESITSSDDYLRTAFAFIRQIYNVSGTLALLRAQLDSVYAPITGSTTYAPIASPTFTGTVTAPTFSGSLTGAASLNVLKAGDTMTGTLTGTAFVMSAASRIGGTDDGGRFTLSGAAGFAGTGLALFETSSGGSRRLRLSQDAAQVTYNATFGSGSNAHVFQIANTDALTINSSGNVVAVGSVSASSFSGSGASLTALNATQLTTGTVPDARFPATLPVASGANLTALNATQLTTGTVPTARITSVAAGATIGGSEIGWRSLPVNSQSTGYTLVVGDRGQMVSTTAGVTVPNSVFAGGDVVTIYNNSAAAITITQGASHTLRLGGTTTTGNRTLAARGIATITFISGTESVATGAGLT